jgi:hypothetical protein
MRRKAESVRVRKAAKGDGEAIHGFEARGRQKDMVNVGMRYVKVI